MAVSVAAVCCCINVETGVAVISVIADVIISVVAAPLVAAAADLENHISFQRLTDVRFDVILGKGFFNGKVEAITH